MKPRIAWLAILLLSLAAVPTWAHSNWTYDNGPINGNTDAWTINFGYIVSDTFVAGGGSYDYVIGFSFGVWEFPGHGPCVLCGPIRDTMYSVQWSITSGENGGMLYGSGTATRSGGTLTDTFLSVNQYGYDMDRVTVTGLGIPVTPGTTYWLNLFNAQMAQGDPVFWDENSGVGCHSQGCPSQASESAVGTIPSEAFTINGTYCCTLGPGGGTPEPSSIILFGSGIFVMARIVRRKLM